MAGKPERVPESYRFRLGTGRSAYPRRSPPRLRSLRFETGPRLGEFLKATRTRGAGDANIGWATGGNRTEPPVKDDGTPTLAERQMGEFLKQMPKATGALREGSAVPERNHGEQPPTLADLNITKKQSRVAQKLATIPEPEFRERIAVVVFRWPAWRIDRTSAGRTTHRRRARPELCRSFRRQRSTQSLSSGRL